MNKQRKKKVFLNFKGIYTEVVFTILFKNEQRPSADYGETIINSYEQRFWHHFQNFRRKKKDFMRHRKSTFYNFLKNITNALCLVCTGHHNCLYDSCERGADHLSLPPWTWSGGRGRELRMERAQPGLTPQLRVWVQGWSLVQSTNAIFFLNQDITVRTEDTEVKALVCPLVHVSVLTAFCSSTVCAPVIKINQVSSFHQHCSNESAAFVVIVLQSLSRIWLFPMPWTAEHQASLSFTISQSLLKFMSIESMMPSTISSSITPFSSCPQSFSASGSFPVSWFFASGGESTGASASALVLPMNSQGWFPLGLTGLISLLSRALSRVFSSPIIWKHQFFGPQSSLC